MMQTSWKCNCLQLDQNGPRGCCSWFIVWLGEDVCQYLLSLMYLFCTSIEWLAVELPEPVFRGCVFANQFLSFFSVFLILFDWIFVGLCNCLSRIFYVLWLSCSIVSLFKTANAQTARRNSESDEWGICNISTYFYIRCFVLIPTFFSVLQL